MEPGVSNGGDASSWLLAWSPPVQSAARALHETRSTSSLRSILLTAGSHTNVLWRREIGRALPLGASCADMSDEDEDILEFDLVGVAPLDIVGIRFANGRIGAGEMAILQRDYENAYDENAIGIYSVLNHRVGFIARAKAAALAPLVSTVCWVLRCGVTSPRTVLVIRTLGARLCPTCSRDSLGIVRDLGTV